MAQLTVTALLARIGKTMYWLQGQTKIHEFQLRRYARNDFKLVRMTDIDKLCKALDCTPGELISLGEPNGNGKGKTLAKRKPKTGPRTSRASASVSP